MYKLLKELVGSRIFSRGMQGKELIHPGRKQRSEHVAVAKQKTYYLSNISGKPLSEPLEGFEDLSYIDPNALKELKPFSSKLSTLSNGLRVASEPIFGEYCTVGVIVDSGTRYEANYPQGVCHFLEKLAFSTRLDVEQSGAMVECQAAKDVFFYASSCHKSIAGKVIGYISDEVFRPTITDETLEISGSLIGYENDALMRNPECEPLLLDWIHGAAFRNNTFGLSKYCKPENVGKVKAQHLLSYLSQYYTPDRIVLGGVGVDHDFLMEAGEKFFNPQRTVWSANSSLLLDPMPSIDNSISQYTGGEIKIARDLSNMAPGPSPFPNLAHLVLGFEAASLLDDDYVPFAVLQSLLGGGGSFSAGGPGKGMFTRLYIDVLHNHGWLYNATASNFSYSDCGLFCIRASAPPNKMKVVPEIILSEYLKLTKGVDEAELNRAKVQLKSNMMMTLEMRPVMFENLVRQSLLHKEIKKPQYYAEKIDEVQSGDIVRIAERMLNSKLSMVAYGDLSYLPTYEKIRSMI